MLMLHMERVKLPMLHMHSVKLLMLHMLRVKWTPPLWQADDL